MKARPRSVERRVAEELSAIFLSLGFSRVERIPVLGRTGPDISINEVGLVIDVKSRLSTPKGLLAEKHHHLYFDNLVGVQLCNLFVALPLISVKPSKIVMDWFNHMDEWRKEFYPQGYSCIILHRPGLDIKASTCILERRFYEQFGNYSAIADFSTRGESR